MTPSEERGVGQRATVPNAAAGIAPTTWLWLVVVGLGFWVAVAEGILLVV